MKITRRNYRQAHRYTATTDDGKVLATDLYGITTSLNVLSKPALVPWAARQGADAIKAKVKQHIETTFTTSMNSSRLREFEAGLEEIYALDGNKAANEFKEKRAQRGSDAHEVCEQIARLDVPESEIPNFLMVFDELVDDDIYLCALAFRQWLDREKPEILQIERALVCVECGYGCTSDFEGILRGEHWTIDIKTSKYADYDSYEIQLCAQDHARRMTDSNALSHGEIKSKPSKTAVLWIGPGAKDGCELVPTPNTAGEFLALRSVLNLHKWRNQRKAR